MKCVTGKTVAIALMLALVVPTVSRAQFGLGGIVYDPTNYANAVLRYRQLVAQLAELQQTYQRVLDQYNLAVRMSKSLQNMPARYQAVFSEWRPFTAADLYGNTTPWVDAANGAGAQTVRPAYRQATIPLLTYTQADLDAINPLDARNLKSAYASVELADGANVSALTTVGNVRGDARSIEQQISNLERDSLSGDPSLNTEVSVLNKINVSDVLTLRSLQDANNLRVESLEQQMLGAKQQRDREAANMNFTFEMRQQATQNLAPFNTNLAKSMAAYRLP